MSKPSLKFKVGQVVFCFRSENYVLLKARDKITHKGLDAWRDDMGFLWFDRELRPLTKKERGG